ncbi:MAG: hypothetical protein EPN23_03520 [Verrucomicrobia bacterium]|nr:MAG: hypothetical protein EPN23_03520 [Verrucomicrobiota bacterium]
MNMWHHRPAHLFLPNQLYRVTAGTHHKEHFFRSDDRLRLLQETFFACIRRSGWELQSWAIFSNHYHFIAQAPVQAETLKPMLQRLHSLTAREINRLDQTAGRKVWFQYWDTCLTYEKSYLARLHYVNHNPVHHGLVAVATQYPFCSAAWFAERAEPTFRRKVESFTCNHITVVDDFEGLSQQAAVEQSASKLAHSTTGA